jgi:hypothetical protein
MSQALRAGEKALVSGSIKAIVASAIGAGFVSDIIGGTIATKVVNGGSIEDAFKGAVIGAAVTFVADGIGEKFAGAIKDANLGDVGTELAHGALGCVTGMIRSQSGSGCVPGAAGAVTGHLLAPVIFNTGFDPLGTGTVQGIKDSAVFFSGVVGGAVAATVGKDDQVNANYGNRQRGREQCGGQQCTSVCCTNARYIGKIGQWWMASFDCRSASSLKVVRFQSNLCYRATNCGHRLPCDSAYGNCTKCGGSNSNGVS